VNKGLLAYSSVGRLAKFCSENRPKIAKNGWKYERGKIYKGG